MTSRAKRRGTGTDKKDRAQASDAGANLETTKQDADGHQNLLIRQLQKTADSLENLHLEEYIAYRKNRKRFFFDNFLGGLARGLGYAAGFTILGALLIMFLRRAAEANLPVIGNVIAEIVKIVNTKLQLPG